MHSKMQITLRGVSSMKLNKKQSVHTQKRGCLLNAVSFPIYTHTQQCCRKRHPLLCKAGKSILFNQIFLF